MRDDQEQLLRQAAAGDEEALSELLKRYAPQISRQLHIRSAHLSKLDTEDILQVTFLEAFLNIRHFDPDRADSFSGWLLRIAENNLHDMVRELHRAKRPPPERQLCRTPDESCTALLEFLMADSATPSRRDRNRGLPTTQRRRQVIGFRRPAGRSCRSAGGRTWSRIRGRESNSPTVPPARPPRSNIEEHDVRSPWFGSREVES